MTRMIALVALISVTSQAAEVGQPWLDASRSPDERATLALKSMTLEEKMGLLHGPMAIPFHFKPNEPDRPIPKEAIPSAGYIPGVRRMGIPALLETDASLGVVNPGGIRPGDLATALPASLALAATFNPSLAFKTGSVVGAEAHAKGFNVLLGGGMDLTRDPRAGRNFEYLGEDPLLAGILAGEAVRGIQNEHVISTVKHYALNAHETNRRFLDARIEPGALRESDLLAFEIAIEKGQPGSVMCSYNLVNGAYACGNAWLLNDVLKGDWHYPGWVMSDWAAVHSVRDAVNGLDQESGDQLDEQVWFGAPLEAAVKSGSLPASRVDDMARRILRTMFAVGIVEHPPEKSAVDYKAHAVAALEVERQGVVLLKNTDAVLPLPPSLKRIAVIGGNAQFGVLSGGGSSQVTPSNGATMVVPLGGRGVLAGLRNLVFFPSSPLKAMQALAPQALVEYDSGMFPADAAALAAVSDVAIVFVTRHEMEGYDAPTMELPNGQNQLVEVVAAANPKTIVVLETGNPVSMPWLSKVRGVVEAWFPGQEGGQAIAEVLFGDVNPSGRLPISFPVDDANSVRANLPNLGSEIDEKVSVDYTEGADVGYRWYARHQLKPLFPFGFGLSYSSFAYENLKVQGGAKLRVSFDVVNTGGREGADVPQVYLSAVEGRDQRLLGFERVSLKAGERKSVNISFDPRFLGHFDEKNRTWSYPRGSVTVGLGRSAGEIVASGQASLSAWSKKYRP